MPRSKMADLKNSPVIQALKKSIYRVQNDLMSERNEIIKRMSLATNSETVQPLLFTIINK